MKLPFKKQKAPVFERRRSSDDPPPRVFSYYARGASNSSQNTGRHDMDSSQKPRSYRRLIYVPSYIALGMIFIAGLYSCWLQPSPRVVIINKEGTVVRSIPDYQSGIALLWRKSILNQTKLTVHGANIKRDIMEQYGELSDVQIELPLLGRRPSVILTPAQPALQFINSNGAFYVNTHGKIMARVDEVTQNQLTKLPLVRDQTGILAEVGKSVVPESEATFLINLSAQLAGEDINVEAITLPSTAANEADVHIAGQAYIIKFSTLTEPRQSVGAYQTVKAKLEANQVVPKEYIDVRVEEKVFYK